MTNLSKFERQWLEGFSEMHDMIEGIHESLNYMRSMSDIQTRQLIQRRLRRSDLEKNQRSEDLLYDQVLLLLDHLDTLLLDRPNMLKVFMLRRAAKYVIEREASLDKAQAEELRLMVEFLLGECRESAFLSSPEIIYIARLEAKARYLNRKNARTIAVADESVKEKLF